MHRNNCIDFGCILKKNADAYALLKGGSHHPDLRGIIKFYRVKKGIVVLTEIIGLPKGEGECENPIFGFHIHTGENCKGNIVDEFADTLGHYNPKKCQHPFHAGDMPPLFGNNGYAFSAFFTDRFNINEIIEKTVIIHSMSDDFTTQPSGNAGQKIACGEIKKAE